MRRILKENGLTITMLGLFACILVGQLLTGYRVFNDELQDHGRQALSMPQYLRSGHFIEAVFENWESEFLQMAALVVLTKHLRQKGSPDSKPLDEKDDENASDSVEPDSPAPAKMGGWARRIYAHSLSLALLSLFLVSVIVHAVGGSQMYNLDQAEHGHSGQAITALQYLGTSQMWFESFQNWQSEFLSVGVLISLAIFLREEGSPESKPVNAPHSKTGEG